MKKLIPPLLLAALVLACLPAVALADCHTEHRECYAEAGKGKYLGTRPCPTCWKWKELACEFCWGNEEPAHRCNSHYSACQDNCWSCLGGRDGCCMDKNGHDHGSCEPGKPKS